MFTVVVTPYSLVVTSVSSTLQMVAACYPHNAAKCLPHHTMTHWYWRCYSSLHYFHLTNVLQPLRILNVLFFILLIPRVLASISFPSNSPFTLLFYKLRKFQELLVFAGIPEDGPSKLKHVVNKNLYSLWFCYVHLLVKVINCWNLIPTENITKVLMSLSRTWSQTGGE